MRRLTNNRRNPAHPAEVERWDQHAFLSTMSQGRNFACADGISEELLNLLAQVLELRVIARTSSFSFKGKEMDIAEIARRLNVANVLEGSVRRSGDTLWITAQLVRASDSSHLWSQTYDREMTDVEFFHPQLPWFAGLDGEPGYAQLVEELQRGRTTVLAEVARLDAPTAQAANK